METQIVITRKPKEKLRGDDGSQIVSVRMKREMVNRIDQIALETNRSRNELINLFVEHALGKIQIVEED